MIFAVEISSVKLKYECGGSKSIEITEIRITLRNEKRLKAFVTVTFDHCFAVRDMKIVQKGDGGHMLCMPSRRLPDGSFKDVAHPISAEFRAHLEKQVFAAFHKQVAAAPDPSSPASPSSPPPSSPT